MMLFTNWKLCVLHSAKSNSFKAKDENYFQKIKHNKQLPTISNSGCML